MDSRKTLIRQVIELAATLKEEDLLDPAIYGRVSQLMAMVDQQDKVEKTEEVANCLSKVSPEQIAKTHILLFPVSISGHSRDLNSNLPDYHATLKVIGTQPSHSHDEIQKIVDRHRLEAPSDLEIEPHVLNSYRGPIYTLRIKSPTLHWDYAHRELSEENPSMYKQFVPHITIGKQLYDDIVKKKLTAKDIGLKVHPLEYRVGHQTVKQFKPIPQATESFVPQKAEQAEESMKKTAFNQPFKDAIAKAEQLKKSLEKVREAINNGNALPLWADRYKEGQHDPCVLDFADHTNERLDQDIVEKLLKPLSKGMKDSYENSLADRKIAEALQGEAHPEKIAAKNLLTAEAANAKTAKNAAVGGYISALLHLAPAGLAGRGNVCPGLSAGCKASCLNTAGRGGMVNAEKPLNTIQKARVEKTQKLFDKPHHFLDRIDREISNNKARAAKEGKKFAVRLNGTSDLAWEKFKHPGWGGQNIIERHPDVQFYDYTARPERVRNNPHPNYHVTFSLKEDNAHIAKQLLKEGHNVAVPFGYSSDRGGPDKRPMPSQHWGHTVIDGDEHDLRFVDPKGDKETGGHVVGLRAKGEALTDTSGFVQWGHEGAPDAQPRQKKDSKEAMINRALRADEKKADEEEDKKSKDKDGEKLAASELRPGMSYNDLKKREKK